MALITNLRSQEPPTFENNVQSDTGFFNGAAGSFNMGVRESVVNVGFNMALRARAGHLDRENGLEPVPREEFDQRFEGVDGFDYRDEETPTQLELRYQDWIQEQVQGRRAQGVGMATGFAFGMLGNMGPDAPLAFIPYAGIAKMAKAANVSLRTGQKLGAAAKTVEALSSNKLSTKLIQGALAGEKQPLKAGETFFQLTKMGAVEQTIENTAVYFGSQALGRDYGTLDAAADTVFGAGILSVLGGFQTRKLMKVGNMMARDITNSKALSLLAEGGDIQAVVKHLNNYSEDVTGTFMDSVEKNPRVQAILQMDEATFNADPKARGELQEFLGRNRAGVFFSTLKGNIPFDTNLSVIDAKRKQHAQMTRIMEALPDYLRGEDVSGRLTTEEMQIIHDTDTNLQRLMETVGGLEQGLFDREIPVSLNRSITQQAFGPSFVIQSPDLPHLRNRFESAVKSLREKGDHIPANRLEESRESLDHFSENPSDFETLSFLTQEVTDAEFAAEIITEADAPKDPFKSLRTKQIPEESLQNTGVYGEKPASFIDSEGRGPSTDGSKVFRGVRNDRGYTVDKEGNLTIHPTRDDMFARRIGEDQGTGTSVTSSPSEAAHFAAHQTVLDKRLAEEELDSQRAEDYWPTILEIDAAAIADNPELKFLAGTENETRVITDKPIVLKKGQYRILDAHTEEGDLLHLSPFEPLQEPRIVRGEELNARFEQELDEFDRSGEELRDLEFDGIMDDLDGRGRGQGTLARREKIEQAYRILQDPDLETTDFTFDQAYDLIRAETKKHWQEIEKTQELVFDIFGVNLKEELGVSKGDELGRYEGFMRTLTYGDLDTYIALGGFDKVTPSSLVFHETVHALADVRPTLWKNLQKIIYSEPALKAKIDRVAATRGYDDAKAVYNERPSILMEMMITEQAFWDALNRQNRSLYNKFKELITRIYYEVLNFNTPNLERISPEDLTTKDITQLSNRIVEVIQKDKLTHEESLSRSDTMFFEKPQPKPRKPMEQATPELEANLEAEASKGREAAEVRNKEAAKEVEGRAKEATKTPLQVAKERVESQLEGDLAQIILDTRSTPEQLLEKLAEVAETLGPEGSPVRVRYEPLVERIIGFKKGTRQNYEHGRDVLQRGTKPDLSTTGEQGFIRLAQLRKRMETEKLSEQEALREYAQWLDEEQMKQALAEINNDKVLHHNDRGLRRMKTSKGKLKYLKSFTDGLQRKGVRLFGGSIQSDINAQITKDMAKLRTVFAKHGFLDELDNTIHRIDGENDIPVTERAAARREASNMFVWDLAQYYKTGEVPDRYGDRKADFEELGEALRDTLHSQITQLNEYGAGIRLRDDHLGMNQRWSDEVIRRMGFDAFRAKVDQWVDWTKVEESHGGMMVASRNEHGYADEMVAFDKEVFIRQWFDEAVSPVKPQDHPSTNIARSFGKARMIHMKPEFEQQSLIEFSGHGSLGRLLQDQIRHRSEMIAVMRNLGNEPLANFDKIVRAAGIDANTNTTRVESGSKLDRALVASGAAHRTHKMDVNHMYKTVEFLTGASDNPANHDLSFWGKSYRQLSNIAFMWTAGVSAITDVPITLLTLEQMGADVSIPQLMGAMKRSATRRFIDKDRGELTAFFEGSGAAFDAMKNAGARRLALAESNGDTFLAKGSEMMFTINGVSGWTSMMQEAFVDVITQSLARQARSGDWDPHMKMTMRSMGFTQDDFLRLSDGIVDINGVDRVGPPSFEGQDLQMKLLQFFSEYRDKAVIVPDASTQSLIRFGTQAGTWQGEAVRSVMQYASFPVAMNRVVNRMMVLNAEGRNPWTTGQIGMTRMVVFAGGMMGLAYAAMVMKDLARLRGPAMPWEMNQATLGRLIDQAGFLGVVGNLAGAAKDGRVSSVMAPNVSTQANVMGKLWNEGFGEALYASRSYTGDNIPIIGPWITTTLAYGFQGGYAEAMRIGANFREREFNVDQLTPVPKP